MSSLLSCVLVLPSFCTIILVSAISQQDYHKIRNGIRSKHLQEETYGSQLLLDQWEEQVDRILLREKRKEIDEGIKSQNFPPAKPFVEAKPLIEKSQVFKIIKLMPKGGLLHVHDLAMIDPEWLVKVLTYRDDCKMCSNGNKIHAFSFKRNPANVKDCTWTFVNAARAKSNDKDEFDDNLLSHLHIEPTDRYSQSHGFAGNDIWIRAEQAWRLGSELIFEPESLEKYYKETLRQFSADGVMYMEMRSLLMANAVEFDFEQQRDFIRIYQRVTEEFKQKHPDYYGSKIIKCDVRFLDVATINRSVNEVIEMRKEFPDFVAGYDLVGQEDLGIPLIQYLDVLLRPSQSDPPIDLPYYFHAGETNWLDTDIDWNLLDAILLNTSRIGHAYALYTHPHLLTLVKEKNIAIEVSPVSNQVLGYVNDARNHPVSHLLANNYPVVVNSDDPALWRSLPLSHDFYYIFMASTGRNAGLRTLKQLAMNSIQYSAMNKRQKDEAMAMWQTQWAAFIQKILKDSTITITPTT